MTVRNNNIIDIYNLSRLIDLAITTNVNAKGTNKAEPNTSKANFSNIYNWNFNVNIK